eukprot:3777224-Rhodomonas_salina.1
MAKAMLVGRLGFIGDGDPPESVTNQKGRGVAELKCIPAKYKDQWLHASLKEDLKRDCWLPDDATFKIQRGSPLKKQECQHPTLDEPDDMITVWIKGTWEEGQMLAL